MAKKIFVASTGQHDGKTSMSICLMHLARRKYQRVGFIKPVGQEHLTYQGREMDKDAVLMAEVYGLADDSEWMSPVVVRRQLTREFLEGKVSQQELSHAIVHAFKHLDTVCDFLIIEGTGHGGVGSVLGLSNARVARLLDAPVLLVTGGGIGKAADLVHLNMALYEKEGAPVRAVLANKLFAEKRAQSLRYLELALGPQGVEVMPGLDYSPVLANPTLGRLSQLLGRPLSGDAVSREGIVRHIQLGAASTQRVVDLLRESTLVVLTSTRDELIVTLSTLYHMPDYREKIAGVIVTGTVAISRISQRILDDSGLPYIRLERVSGDVFYELKDYVAKIGPEDKEKINLLQEESESVLDFAKVDALAR